MTVVLAAERETEREGEGKREGEKERDRETERERERCTLTQCLAPHGSPRNCLDDPLHFLPCRSLVYLQHLSIHGGIQILYAQEVLTHFYMVNYYIWVKPSWTYSIYAAWLKMPVSPPP